MGEILLSEVGVSFLWVVGHHIKEEELRLECAGDQFVHFAGTPIKLKRAHAITDIALPSDRSSSQIEQFNIARIVASGNTPLCSTIRVS